MRKLITLLCLTILTCGILFSCSQVQEKSTDDAFLSDLALGLEARWNLTESDPNRMLSSKDYQEYISKELDYIAKYRDIEFKDKQIGELALSYINALDSSLLVAKTYSPNNAQSVLAMNDAYASRVIALKNIADNYNIPVSKKYQEIFDGLLADGANAEKVATIRKQLTELANNMEVIFAPSSFGYSSGIEAEATVSNPTDLEFNYISFNILLYNAENVRIDTCSLYIENWKPGETVTKDIYTSAKQIPAYYQALPEYFTVIVNGESFYYNF